jgi:hypothetical protein
MRSKIWRSASILAAAACATLGLAAAGPARAETVFGGVRIDLSAIPNGAYQTKQQLQACLQSALPAALAGRITPGARGAPLLVVRPLSVWLASSSQIYSQDDFGRSTGTTSLDSLEGEAIVGGARIPVTVSANPDFGTQGLPEHNAAIRTEALCRNFAYWVARRV